MILIYFNTDIPYHYYSTIKLSNSKKKHDIIILPISAWMKKALLFWIYPYLYHYHHDKKKKLKSVYLLRLVTQCSVQSISVQLCFDSEKQRSFPTIKFTFIVIYILILLLLYYTSAKSLYFPHPKKMANML